MPSVELSVPKVSLIVPVYQPGEWWQQCLHSIRSQDYGDVELLIEYDDERTGPAAARNRGLDKATGEFVMFVDADDFLEPGAITKMVEAIDGVDWVAASFRKFGDFEAVVQHEDAILDLRQVATYAMGNLKNPRSSQLLSGCWAKLYRRNLYLRFPELKTAEDMALNFDYLRRCKRVRFIPDIVYHNRKRNGSLTTTFSLTEPTGLFGFLEGLKYVKRFLSGFYSDGELEDAIDHSKVYHSILYYMRICASTGEPMNDVFKKLYP